MCDCVGEIVYMASELILRERSVHASLLLRIVVSVVAPCAVIEEYSRCE